MTCLILNQYRNGSFYKDEVGTVYHFPRRYLKRIQIPDAKFIYYEPRAGGEQVYFGTGAIGEIWSDPEDPKHCYSEILDYSEFPTSVSYWGFRGKAFEPARTMRNSVRLIEKPLFDGILKAAGFGDELARVVSLGQVDLEALYKDATPEMRRFLATRYERPGRVTKFVKETLGSTCQVCGYEGFSMRNGKRYCEVHHLFHLARLLPGSLGPRQLIIVCATCHRKLHYGPATDPVESDRQWVFELCGQQISIPIFAFVQSNEQISH